MKNYIKDGSIYKAGKSNIINSKKNIKLSSNENALGCSPKVTEYIKAGLKDIHRYPDSGAYELKYKLSTKFNINSEQITLGNGSDEIISFICHGFLEEGDEVIQSEHGFLMYSIYSKNFGAKVIKVKEENNKIKSSEIIQNINNKTKIIFLANPNNPTSAISNTVEIYDILKKIPKNIIFVLDLAYAEFIDNCKYQQSFDLVNEFPNLIITRTFSKIHGLASLRIGYSYSSLKISHYLNKIKGPFNVSAIAQKSAIISLEDEEFFQKSVNHNKESLKLITTQLDNLGIRYNPSLSNFLLLKFKSVDECQKVNKSLLDNGIIVREVLAYGLAECLRVTVGTKEENHKILDILQKVSRETY